MRTLGWVLLLAAAAYVAGDMALQTMGGRLQPAVQQHVATALPGIAVHWGRVRVLPWGALVFDAVQVTPEDPAQPRGTASRLVLGYRWRDLWAGRWAQVRQIRAVGVTVAAPGAPPLVRHGQLEAEWRDEQLIIREARAECLGVALRTHGVLTGVTTGDPRWRIELSVRSPQFWGQLSFLDRVRAPRIIGEMAVAHAAPVAIETRAILTRDRLEASPIRIGAYQAVSGVIDWAQSRWAVTLAAPAGGSVTAQGSLTAWAAPEADIVFDQVRVGPATVSSMVHLTANWGRPAGQRAVPALSLAPGAGRGWDILGTVTTHGTRINEQVVGELSGAWSATREQCTLASWEFGDRLRLSGTIGMARPYPLALTVILTDVDLARVAATVEPGKAPLAAGLLQGVVDIAGPMAAPSVRGTVIAYDGRIGKTPFTMASVSFEGEGTVIRFRESRLRQPGQVVRLEGTMDLSRVGTSSVFQHVRMTPRPLTEAEPSP